MTVIKLRLPDELALKLQSITSSPEAFIVNLLQNKVNEQNSSFSLADEYHLAAEENKPLLKEFAHTDTEGWDDDY